MFERSSTCPSGSRRSTAVALLALGVLGPLGAWTLSAAVPPAQAASIQISSGLSYSDVNFNTTRPQISPDGQYAVYRQDALSDGVVELWSVPVDGSTQPVRLSDVDISTQGQFMTFEISSDSARVVYAVDQDITVKTELYSVPIAGGNSTKISRQLSADRDVIGFKISPTSDRVFYLADPNDWTEYELYSVSIEGPGSSSVRLNAQLSGDFDVEGFQVSPDGDTVIYRAGRNATGIWELYNVPSVGPSDVAFKVSGALGNGGAVASDFQITPNGSRVIYRADSPVDETYTLFSIPLLGNDVDALNEGVAANTSVDTGFLISPNSAQVVFRAQGTGTVYQLYSRPPGRETAAVRLNGTLQVGEDVEAGFQISANSSKVVYRSDEDVNDLIELYSVPIAGVTAPTKLNGAILTGGGDVLKLAISPNSARVIYLADQIADTLNELFSVPIGGGTAVKLNRTLVSGGDVQAYRVSPNSSWVVYGADQDVDTIDELLAVPIAGGTVLNVNDPLVFGGDVKVEYVQNTVFDIAPNSLDIIYGADQDFDDQIELYSSSLGGPPGAPTAVVAIPGNTQATVTFAAPASNGGSAITGFTVSSDPAGGIDSNAGTTALTHGITNLVNGTPYTFTVRATNANGVSEASAPSNSVIPAVVPAAPTGLVATARYKSADITFVAPASNGGSPILGYIVTSTPPGGVDLQAGSTALSHQVSGLVATTSYTFTAVAVNAIGAGPASAPSNAVTPSCDPLVVPNLFCDGVETNDTSAWDFTQP